MNLIAKHLLQYRDLLTVEPCNTVCAFTGQPITEGVPNKLLIKETFTDHEYLKFPSDYSSVEAALCIESVIPGNTRRNALRNYSYLATEQELRLLKREEILDIILFPPAGPFVLVVTYSNKKHTAYKAVVNHSRENFTVTTDIGQVEVTQEKVGEILPIIQAWYTAYEKDKTYFTKDEILNSTNRYDRIYRYGITQYFQDTVVLDKYRGTALLQLLTHILNKSDVTN